MNKLLKLLSISFIILLFTALSANFENKVKAYGADEYIWNENSETDYKESNGFTYVIQNGKAYIDSLPHDINGTVVIPKKLGKYPVIGINYLGTDSPEQIKEIIIHKDITYISENAFFSLPELEAIQIEKGNQYFYKDKYGVIYSKKDKAVVCSPAKGKITTYTIPDGIKEIGLGAFSDNSLLKKAVIPATVTKIGDSAFVSNVSLENIVFSPDSKLTEIGAFAFVNCPKLRKIELPKNLKVIGSYALSGCNNLKSISIPASVKTIEEKAFGYLVDENGFFTEEKDKNLVINCLPGSPAEKYAKKEGFKYKLLSVGNVSKIASKSYESKIKLAWTKVSGATGYRIYKYNSSAKKWETVANTKNTSYIIKNLKAGNTYKFTVRAYIKSDNIVAFSPKFKTYTTSTIPSSVSFSLKAEKNKVAITWDKVPGATGYQVFYKTDKNGQWVKLTTTDKLSFKKTNLISSKTYYFTVKAYKLLDGTNYFSAYKTQSIKTK